ncbi:MAG: DNA polymerase III subunit gamma/tau [Gammaproteobacteria bacterium]|nr:DNA polymerase III subunit gamma/tau [Gammaproteobacteria bacterium]
MAYAVLARKWRPRSLQEMVGQEHILRMLTNALERGRLHHAYLFAGTRGVGKTTLARILAKCLNCEKSISANPCGTCQACLSIDAGKFPDLIEVDAASRTKVEDTRDLLETIQYAPAQGRFKICLIDEVHMLSTHSFNALLKTLEEPPSHVIFLLATTDPQKLPITVLSRCLQFHLNHVSVEKMIERLAFICESEKITADASALQEIAIAARGSLRDALSLLDQAIAWCGDHVTLSETREMLGCVDSDYLFHLLDAIAAQNGEQLLQVTRQACERAPDIDQLIAALLTLLHQISIQQVIADDKSADTIKQFAAKFSASDIQLFYQIALIGRRDLDLAPNPALGFEMMMLRMLAFQPTQMSQEKNQPTQQNKIPEKATPTMAPSNDWRVILSALKLSGMSLALAEHCVLSKIEDHRLELSLAEKHGALLSTQLKERIQQALSEYFKKPIKLSITLTADVLQSPAAEKQKIQQHKQQQAVTAIHHDQNVQKIMSTFGATLEDHSIESTDEA